MRILITILLFFILTGCKKEKIELCDSPQCNEYLGIWENLFKSRNAISDDYFKEHINVTKTSIETWNDGESFRVFYTVKIDWATIGNSDQFIIKIDSTTAPPYPSLTVSRTNYLTESEISEVVDMRAFSSNITRVSPENALKYSSKFHAVKALQNMAGTTKMKFSKMYYKESKLNFNANGHPFMVGHGEIKKKENNCMSGEIDLVTGIGEVHKTPCWIN